MIAEVTGEVRWAGADTVIVRVGGIGLSVQCTPDVVASLRVGAQATLATSLVVREDSLTLYGFADADTRAVFETLQTATGVGPRLAQAVLATLSPDAVRAAVAAEDLTTLVRVPGVGRKGAQRLVLELRDRLGAPSGGASRSSASLDPVAAVAAWQSDVRTGLLGLGYGAREADEAVAAVAAELAADGVDPAELDLADVLRRALAFLRRR